MECFGKLFEADPCENVGPAAVCGAGEPLPQLRSTGTSPSECQWITNCWIWSKDLQLMSFKHWIEKWAENDGLGYPVWRISNHIFTYSHFEFDCNFDDLPGPQSSLRWRQQGMGAWSLVEPPESHCLSLKLQWVLQPLGSKH